MNSEIGAKKSFFGDRAHGWTNPIAKEEKRKLLSQVLELLSLPENCRLLDLCSGRGAALPLIFERLDTQSLVVAADITFEMVAGAPSLGQLPLQANGYELPFTNESFDSIFCMAGLAHFKDAQRAIREMERVLKVGGQIAIVFLSCSKHINDIHENIGGPVAQDKVPTLAQVDKWFHEQGLSTKYLINEQRRLYFALGHKESKEERAAVLWQLLRAQLSRYPNASSQDLYKVLHQSVNGPEHALSDVEAARRYLNDELNGVEADDRVPLVEVIGLSSPIYRVNLAAYKARGLCRDKLFQAFVETQGLIRQQGWKNKNGWTMEKVGEILRHSLWPKDIPLLHELLALFEEQEKRGYPALHHSAQFRADYEPAYRIVSPATGLLPWLSLEDVISLPLCKKEQ